MGYLKTRQLPEEDERALRKLAWKKLGSAGNYETLLEILADAYEIGVKEGHSKGYIEGVTRGIIHEVEKDEK